MMTADDARTLRDEFLPRFSSAEAYEESWKRCWETLRKPSARQGRDWLEQDLGRDAIMAGGLGPRDPLLPVRQAFELTDCPHCGGLSWLRVDRRVGEEGFGQLVRCEHCGAADHPENCPECRAKTDEKSSETTADSAQEPAQKPRDYVAELATKMRGGLASHGLQADQVTDEQIRAAAAELAAYRASSEYLAEVEALRAEDARRQRRQEEAVP